MTTKKDADGFELQTTVAAPPGQGKEKRQSIPTETPKVPGNGGSGKAPPKPSKSIKLPSNNGQSKTTATVESGNNNSKAIKASQEALVAKNTGSMFAINTGYFKSWQAVLSTLKLLCLISMLVSLSIPLSAVTRVLPRTAQFASIWQRLQSMQFGIALSVIGIVIELFTFILYLFGFNGMVNKQFGYLPWVLVGCHSLMLILVFTAPITLIVARWIGAPIISFIAFDIIAFGGYVMELYFNMVWLKGGPELACLPCF